MHLHLKGAISFPAFYFTFSWLHLGVYYTFPILSKLDEV